MQINPGLSITKLTANQLQIGSGYRALEITGISQPIGAYLQRLRQGIPDGQEPQVAAECEVSQVDFALLMSKLAPLLVSTPFTDSAVTSSDQDHRGSLTRLRCVTPIFEGGRLRGLAPHDEDQFQTQRYGAALQIFGLGRTGVALAGILQDSGIGHLSVWDSQRVTATDVGTGLRDEDIGAVRSLAAATALNPKHQRPRIHPIGRLRQPSLTTLATVHITLGRWHTATMRQAKDLRHPYLPVVIRDDEIDIGPWVVHEAAACPMCLEHPSTATDVHRRFGASSLTSEVGGIETLAGAHLVAGLIATDVLSMVDSQHLRHRVPVTKYGMVPGLNLNTFTRIHLANGWVQTFEVEPRPGCCAAVQELKIASTSVP